MPCKRCGKEAEILVGVMDEDEDSESCDVPPSERDKDLYCHECMWIVHKDTMLYQRAIIESMIMDEDEPLH